MENINIVLASSKEYMKYAFVTATSLVQNRANNNITLHIIHSEDIEEELTNMRKIEGLTVNDYLISEKIYSEACELECGVWNPATWYRWCLLDILPSFIDRVMLIGTDLIFIDDVSDFYYSNFEIGKMLIMCPDMNIAYSDNLDIHVMNEMNEFGIKNREKYYNADVVLIDLKNLRKVLTWEKLYKFSKEKSFIYLDQDMINFYNHEWIQEEDTYVYNYVPQSRISNKKYQMIDKVKIIHFAGQGIKPWKQYKGEWPFEIWWKIAKQDKDNYLRIMESLVIGQREEMEQHNILISLLNRQMNIMKYLVIDNLQEKIFPYYLKNKKIAIYGYGRMGQILESVILKYNYDLTYVIDKNDIVTSIPSLKYPCDLPDNIDIVIVTITMEFEKVIDELNKKTDAMVVSVYSLFEKNNMG